MLSIGAVLRKILFLIPVVVSLSVYFALSDSKSGYLNANVAMGSTTVYFGSQLTGGRVYLWSDKKSGVLYADAEKSIDNGFTKDVSSLRFTGKTANGLYETVINVSTKDTAISETLPESLKEYEKKYYELCSTCHAAAEPNRYAKHRWDSILKSMQQHAGMSDSDLNAIRRYVLLSITD